MKLEEELAFTAAEATKRASPIEHVAYQAMTSANNVKAGLDWGNPGKNHQTTNDYND